MRIKGFEAFQISGIVLKKACGRLSVCRALLHMAETDLSACLGKQGQKMALYTDDDTPLFFGIIQKVTIGKTIGGAKAQIEAVAQAVGETQGVHRRFFQKPEKKFGDILTADRLKMKKCQLAIDKGLNDENCELLLLQAESNFEFIKRLAKETGRKFWVVDTLDNSPSLEVGFYLNNSAFDFDPEKIIQLSQINSVNGPRLEVISRQYCEFGRKAKISGIDGEFIVTWLKASIENGRDIFHYKMEEFTEEGKSLEKPCDGKCCILPGEIADTQDPDNMGRVKFTVDKDFAEDEDDPKSWLPWLTPYAGGAAGMVFIPEKGDPAELVLSSGNGHIRGALRSKALPEEAQNIADKYLGNNFKQRIIWKEDSLEIHSNDSYIIAKADSIEIKSGDASIKLEKDIDIQTSGGNVVINGKKILLG